MSENRKKSHLGRTIAIIVLALTGFALVIKTFLHGQNVALFNPKGMIAQEQLNLILLTFGILMLIAVPTLTILYFTAWKYRESNTKATHDPDAKHGKVFNAAIWLIPGVFAVALALIMWPATHKLAPQKSIAADAKPITIQVVSMRWKWLFIYPEQKIATVNFVQIPVNTPVRFEMTADDSPMSSFWIPNLSGMLYTMTGHSNRLNLIADTVGDYPGRSGEINGAGFSEMQFTTRASSVDDFDEWVNEVRAYNNVLDTAEYDRLLKPSEKNPAAFYSAAEGDLYGTVLKKYMGAGGGHDHTEQHGADH
jgi:cytochrome o ubiquinol oxidase subunit 2